MDKYAFIGTDITLDEDLTLDAAGNLRTTSGRSNLSTSLIRRLSTPLGGYERFVRTPDGYQQIDSNYGSNLYSYLSQSLTELTTDQMVSALQQAAIGEERLNVTSAEVTAVSLNKVNLALTYVTKEGSTLQTSTIIS